MTFIPTPLATPIVRPSAYSAYKAAAYLSCSEYRFAPTSVSTKGLVPGSTDGAVDSTASLAAVIARASKWMDDHCFHGDDGSLAASVAYEQMAVTMKPDGSLVLICNFKPIREVVGVGLGPTASQMSDIGQNAANNLLIGDKTITLPGGFCSGYPTPWFGPWPSINGVVIATYSYVAGWPHSFLTADASAGDMEITVTPAIASDLLLYGAYAGTALTIKDDANTETVFLASTPTGLTLDLVSPLQYGHTVPDAPDAIPVTALPAALEEACIAMVNVLIKTQGMRAQVLPGAIGQQPAGTQQAVARAGALGDFTLACKLLKPFVTTYRHG